MPKQQYDTNAKAQALATLAAAGGNLSETARLTGIPRKTIAYWAGTTGMRTSPATSGITGEQRRIGTENDRIRLADTWRRGALLNAKELLDEDKVRKASLKDNATAAAIAQDKLAMLTGGVTARIENQVRVCLVAPDGRSFPSLKAAAEASINDTRVAIPARSGDAA